MFYSTLIETQLKSFTLFVYKTTPDKILTLSNTTFSEDSEIRQSQNFLKIYQFKKTHLMFKYITLWNLRSQEYLILYLTVDVLAL